MALANAYNYIATKDPYDALAFITDVYSKGEDDSEMWSLRMSQRHSWTVTALMSR